MRRSLTTVLALAFVACGGGPTSSNLSGGDTQSGSASQPGGSASSETADVTGPATDGQSTGTGGSTSEPGPTDGASDDASDSASGTDATTMQSETTGTTAAGETTSTGGATDGSDSSSTGDGLIGPGGVLDLVIYAANDCTFTTDPASITVPEGTEFTVNWINDPTSEVEVDVAKIDPFNQVPIVLGLEVGNSHHDDVREWCGTLFTGTFSFRVTSCADHHYIDVDCGGS